MRWALKRRTIRPLIPVCLMAMILVVFSSNIVIAQTSRTLIKVKDVPTIFPEPNMDYGEPGDSPLGRTDYVTSAYPYDPSRRNDKEDIVIKQLESHLNSYYWLSNYIPLLKQIVVGF